MIRREFFDRWLWVKDRCISLKYEDRALDKNKKFCSGFGALFDKERFSCKFHVLKAVK